MSENSKVLHRLHVITESLDRASKTIRSSEADTKLKVKNWIVTWFLIPFHSLSDLKGLFKGAKSLNISPALPLLAGTILLPIASSVAEIKWYILLGYGALIGYLISLIFVAPRSMCDFNSGYFRIGAYSLFRQQEYEIFRQSLVHEDEFYFSSIPMELQLLIKADDNVRGIHTRIDNFLLQEKAELEQKIKILDEKYSEKEKEHRQAIHDYDSEVTRLLNANHTVHKGVGYLVEFLKAAKIAIARKTNGKLNITDISNLISAGVSIFEVKDDHIILKGEEFTLGDLPPIIRLDDDKYSKLPYVDAAKNAIGEAFDEVEENHFIISRRFIISAEEHWIVSFHVDGGSEKALFLTVGNDILDTKEVYKTIHSLCLLLKEQELKQEV